MSDELFVMSTEVQTEYERGFADGKAYMRDLADSVIAQTTEIEERNARLVAALTAAHEMIYDWEMTMCLPKSKEIKALWSIIKTALQQSAERP